MSAAAASETSASGARSPVPPRPTTARPAPAAGTACRVSSSHRGYRAALGATCASENSAPVLAVPRRERRAVARGVQPGHHARAPAPRRERESPRTGAPEIPATRNSRGITISARFGRIRTASDAHSPPSDLAAPIAPRSRTSARRARAPRGRHVAHRLDGLIEEDRTASRAAPRPPRPSPHRPAAGPNTNVSQTASAANTGTTRNTASRRRSTRRAAIASARPGPQIGTAANGVRARRHEAGRARTWRASRPGRASRQRIRPA